MNDDPIIRFSLPQRAAAQPDPIAEPLVRRKPQALGRGLGALLGEARQEEASRRRHCRTIIFSPTSFKGLSRSATGAFCCWAARC